MSMYCHQLKTKTITVKNMWNTCYKLYRIPSNPLACHVLATFKISERHSQSITYIETRKILKTVISIKTLLLQTTNRKWRMAHGVPFQMTTSDHWPRSFTYCNLLQMQFLCHCEAASNQQLSILTCPVCGIRSSILFVQSLWGSSRVVDSVSACSPLSSSLLSICLSDRHRGCL